ncbi:MAG: prepilin-type N-terminal cleavage/methylation domain-containing protein [Candidatus Krumholzibacteriia bacterium]|jgi:prepilin-type N-terminal cleavage/methylation domain-containing protein
MGRKPITKKGIGKMNCTRTHRHGFTLIEIVIAVAIVAIFAAALSPMVFRHLGDAKLAKAQNESEVIAGAVLSYYKDVGAWPYTSADGPSGTGVARVISSALVATGTGTGAGTGAASWGTNGTAKLLGDYLYFNNPDEDSSADGTNSDQVGADWPVSGLGSWRGPYVDSYEFNDPWGRAYVINVQFAPGGSYSGTVRHKVFALSAGPNGTWETAWDDGVSEEVLGDDIGTIITVR